jgi:dTDP-4-dehydrorhamnose 3,5-epimerase
VEWNGLVIPSAYVLSLGAGQESAQSIAMTGALARDASHAAGGLVVYGSRRSDHGGLGHDPLATIRQFDLEGDLFIDTQCRRRSELKCSTLDPIGGAEVDTALSLDSDGRLDACLHWTSCLSLRTVFQKFEPEVGFDFSGDSVRVIPTDIPEVLILELERFPDHRGAFVRHWDAQVWAEAGIGPFVQDNLSQSDAGVLRGLHFQRTDPQGKLVSVMAGAIYDVAVDIRPGRASFGQWVGVTLRADEPRQLWVPPGFAHGFCVVGGPAVVHYRCTTAYAEAEQGGILWSDPALGIPWPVSDPILSERDQALPGIAAIRSA